MTTEFLLDAVGLIDDELIQDTEVCPAPKVIPWRRLSALAACFALVLTAGYALTHLGMGGSAPSRGGEMMDNTIESAGSGQNNASWGDASPATPSEPESGLMNVRVSVTGDGLTYTYAQFFPCGEDHGPMVDALPEGCRPVGIVQSPEDDISVPHTDIGVYEGCALWLPGDGWEGPLYLELPEGGYLVFEYSQTYDFSGG